MIRSVITSALINDHSRQHSPLHHRQTPPMDHARNLLARLPSSDRPLHAWPKPPPKHSSSKPPVSSRRRAHGKPPTTWRQSRLPARAQERTGGEQRRSGERTESAGGAGSAEYEDEGEELG